MSYFSKIGNSISVKSKEIVRNAKAASETSSLNNIIKAEQQKIEANYKMIGKLYFQKFNQGPSEDFKEYVDAVKDSIEKINEVNNEIAKIKSRNCCPNCGARFSVGSVFCSKCGARVQEKTSEINMPKCSNCGTVLKKGALFCDGCGTKIPEALCSENIEQACSDKSSVDNAGNINSDASSDNKINGAEVNSMTDSSQITDGTTVDSSVNSAQNTSGTADLSVDTAQNASETVDSNTDSVQNASDNADSNAVSSNVNRFCTSCGAEQDDDAIFCIDCGAKLE